MSWVVYGPGASALLWLIVLLLPWRPWSTRERLEAAHSPQPPELDDVAVLIPARNEAQVLPRCLGALAGQGSRLKVVVVDDQSNDGTAAVARSLADDPGNSFAALSVVDGGPLPAGWSGKVWALEQGSRCLDRPLTLLLDADIEIAPGLIAALRQKLGTGEFGLVSLMAEVPTERFWEKLLLPAFVYFFKLLYPFRLSNSPGARVAAAAGGCVLLKTEALADIGGFAALRDALIDDCRLALLVKRQGYRTWIGLTHSARSRRSSLGLGEIWAMVERTAYTQLGYSVLWLAVCTVLMLIAFVVPVVAAGGWFWVPQSDAQAGMPGVEGGRMALVLAVIAMGAMVAAYVPTLRFYGLPWVWGAAMPAIGTLFLAMTWSSALRYWRGRRSQWKSRVYGT